MTNRELAFERTQAALLLVDLQRDFLPGGALAVAEGDRILEPIGRFMKSGLFTRCVATQDWHPAGHASFASSHQGASAFDSIELHGHQQTLWPDHCVQGSRGAELHPGLPWEAVAAIVRKGMDIESDSYSGFRNNWNGAGERPPTGLAGYLRDNGISTLILCGLARDFCVKWTAEDAVAAGFATLVMWDLTRPVDPRSDGRVREQLLQAGVGIVNSAELNSLRAV